MSNYYIFFNLNGFNCNVQAKKDKMFAELVLEFKKMAQLTDEDKPTFSFNGNQIKGDSCKTLEELGIFGGAVIMVTGVNRPNMQNNAGNFAMGNQGFYQNQGMGNMPFMGMGYNQMAFNPNNGMGNMYGGFGMGGMGNPGNFNNFGNPGNVNNFGNPGNPGNVNNFGNPGNSGNVNNFGNPGNPGNTNNSGNPGNAGNTNNSGNAGNDNIFNILFTLNGKNITIQGNPNMKFSEVVVKFSTKALVTPDKLPTFFLNSEKVSPDDQRTLSELKLRNYSRIDVVLQKEIIGAKNIL